MPSIIYASQAPTEQLQRAISKSDWYDLLGQIEVESSPTFDGEDSFLAWQYALEEYAPHIATAKIFQGDYRSAEDDSQDPHVAYLSIISVEEIAAEMSTLGRGYFQGILQQCGNQNDIWLFDGLVAFLKEAVTKQTPIFVLWGH
jgi:hypothetical protein